MEMTRLVTKLLGPPEELDACACFPGHVNRWMVFGHSCFKVYLHHSSNENGAVDLRHYPQKLISIGFAHSSTNDDDQASDTRAERAIWMVLIAKSMESYQTSHTAGPSVLAAQ